MKSLRSAWGKVGCPVYVATPYKALWMHKVFDCPIDAIDGAICDDKSYKSAKRENDTKAALDVCRKALNKAYRVRVKMEVDKLKAKGYSDPILVAPCKSTSKNALPKAAANFLGKKLKIEVDSKIQEVPCALRSVLDRRSKFFQRPEFTGEVEKNRLYILIDDMTTTGATLAELRSYIIKNGGQVAFACSLASCDGMDKQLHPSIEALLKAQKMFGKLEKTVRDFLKTNIGLTPETLTDAEADYLSSGKGQYALQQYLQSAKPS